MKPVNGVKVFNVGDCDCFYAPTKEEAIEEANRMCGPNYVGDDGDIPLEDVSEYTDEQFEKGLIIDFGDDGDPLQNEKGKYVKITCQQHLEKLTADGSKVGHYSTSEW